jgi:hypothetical protein
MLTFADTPAYPAAAELSVEGCRVLLLAVLWTALVDAKHGDADARAWVNGTDARHYADLLKLDSFPPPLEGVSVYRR